ncbi:SIR2 family protein [Leeuwenhoekiella sp. A16]|uniref:SIR2 family protein n=1 Tax=Leeuwenhoekiella sp. A16 TaxID=3141462 RepID=UPI003A8003B3
MKINLNNIAFSIYSNRGIFALLLGSGISRNSGIPTGWDIVIDLIKKIARLENENCEQDPEEWYRNKFNEEPDYSNILEKLAATPTERLNILKSYFEGNNDNDLYQPTIGHKSIAKLIKKGYFRVIVTTNFDRLIEKALLEEGIEPLVIRHPSDIEGTMPLVHSKFVIIKINGDYLDSRFLNTKQELNEYPEDLNNYLLKIFNDFGIISCGWSAKWDIGLLNCLKQCNNFRFSSYWSFVHQLNPELKEIADLRKGNNIQIENADHFFKELLEKVEALETFDREDPLSADIAVARLKKYISKEEYIIELRDLLIHESLKVRDKIQNAVKPNQHLEVEQFREVLNLYHSSLEILIPLCINATYWSKEIHHKFLKEILLRLNVAPKINGGYRQESFDFNLIPSLFILYSLGITAIKTKNYKLLNEIFQIKINDLYYPDAEKIYFISKVNSTLIEKEFFNKVLNSTKRTPMSSYIKEKLRPFLQDLIFDDFDFEQNFALFEYLLSLNYSHLVIDKYHNDWAPLGEYQWKYRYFDRGNNALKDFIDSANKEESNWTPIQQGMFNGSYQTFKVVFNKLEEFRKHIHY